MLITFKMAEPTDNQLFASIRGIYSTYISSFIFFEEILNNADLTEITSKKVRKTLEEHFSLSLTDRKSSIDAMIMRVLKDKENKKDPGLYSRCVC